MEESRILTVLLQLGILIFSLCLHEFGHALAATKLGDPTPKMLGRLTLDPRAHVDPLGTILFPLLMILMPGLPLIGWARPVPVTAENFPNPRRDMALVAVAGPAMNLLLAVLALLGLGLLAQTGFSQLESETKAVLVQFLLLFLFINFFLALFNLLPIPPLDGGWFLKAVLPGPWAYKVSRFEPYSIFLLWGLLQFGILNILFVPALSLLSEVFQWMGMSQLLAGSGL